MCAQAGQPNAHEEAMARLLAEALQPRGVSPAACPDAETVAIYAEQGLAESERAGLESHFAGCQRCQRVLAALGAGLEATAGEFFTAAPAPIAPRPAERRTPWQPRWLWWLSPAVGAAAAALLWMALRPAVPEGIEIAGHSSPQAGQAADTLTAQANLPAPAPEGVARGAEADSAAAGTRGGARPIEQSAEQASREAAFGGGLRGGIDAVAPVRNEVAAMAAPGAGSVPAAPPLPAAQPEVATAAAPPIAVAQAMSPPEQGQVAQPAAPLGFERGAVANGQAALRTRTALSLEAMPQQLAASAPQAAASPAQIALYVFSPPSGGVIWRLGTGGLIERSTDQGRTWQLQESGVTNDLIAGSAFSREVAWVVGRGGVILRTIDGEHWERINPPAGVTAEWAAVAAYDAMNATVVAENLRRYSTRDGGQTWTPQQ